MVSFVRNLHLPMQYRSEREALPRLVPLITVPFLIGTVFGAVVGSFSDNIPGFFSSCHLFEAAAAPAGFAGTLWWTGRYLFCILLLSAGLPGVVLLPVLAFVRAFCFSCEVAAGYVSQRYTGLSHAALHMGLPALFDFPAFLLLACLGLRFSARLFSTFDHAATPGFRPFYWRHLFLVFLLFLAEFFYRLLILPRLA